jgi:hypothetical protein
LEAFCNQHSNWADKLSGKNPVYRLPEFAIRELERMTPKRGNARARRAFLTACEANAEREFLGLCEANFAVGFLSGKPVRYDLLLPSPQAPTKAQFEALGWGKLKDFKLADKNCTWGEWRKDYEALESDAERMRSQMRAYVGWLFFGPKRYRVQLQALRKQAEDDGVPLEVPFFPESAPSSRIRESKKATNSAHSLILSSLFSLLRSAELLGLATWDLPIPRGASDGIPAAVHARLFDPAIEVTSTPTYMRLTRKSKQARPKTDWTPPSDAITGKNGQPSQYDRAFTMWFVELSVRSRYAGRGLAERLASAFQDGLKLSADRIRAIRALYRSSL